jgi:alpha-glucosidase
MNLEIYKGGRVYLFNRVDANKLPMIVKNFKIFFVILYLFSLTGLTFENSPIQLASPNNSVLVNISIKDGFLFYLLKWNNKTIIEKSRLGMELKEDFEGGFKIHSIEKSIKDTTWVPVWGKCSKIRNHYNQLILILKERGKKSRYMKIIIRAYNDGIAFRYSFPLQKGLKEFKVVTDKTQFNFTEDYVAWAPNGEHHNLGPWLLSEFNNPKIPFTIKVNPNCYIAIHEAAKFEFADFTLSSKKGSVNFTANMDESNLKSPTKSSWRVIMIGESAGDLLESNLLVNLNPPCGIKDPSWIETGKSMWDWRTIGAKKDGFTYGCNTETIIKFIDFASENNIKYILLDAGWRGKDPITPKKGLDLKYILKHSKEHNIKIILYYDEKGIYKNHNIEFERILSTYHKWGVAGIKYGYLDEEPQKKVKKMMMIVDLCAKYKLFIDFHDNPLPPGGERRTYPNILTREYCHAQADARRAFLPVTMVTAVFVNMLGGPLDMNNGYYELNEIVGVQGDREKIGEQIRSTVVSETARCLVTFSGLVILPDHDKAYKEKNDLFEFIKNMPTNWDETKILNSSIGNYITVARRKGREWFVGSLTNGQRRRLKIPLKFLEDTRYKITIYKDDNITHYLTQKEAYKIEEREVTPRDTITAEMAPGGGYCIWVRPLK